MCLIPSMGPQDGGVSSRVTHLRKAEAAMKRQEQCPDGSFAPGQMVANSEPPSPIALDHVELGLHKREVRIIERVTEKVLQDLTMVGGALWVAKIRTAESQSA